MHITRNTDIKKAEEAFGDVLFSARNEPVLLLLSGGSAFEILSGVSSPLFGKHLTIGMLDERFETNSNINNFLQLQKTDFYEMAKLHGAQFINSVPKENELLETFSARIEEEWRRWRKENVSGKIIITEGVGSDGHTAGVMSFPENPELFAKLFLDDNVWVRGYDTGIKNKYSCRATATFSFLKNEVDVAIVNIMGEAKKMAFEKIIDEGGVLAQTPARILRDMKDVKIFTNI